MIQTFTNLPDLLEQSVAKILHEERSVLSASAESLHTRYVTREKSKEGAYLSSFPDALAYLALRFPATYAQITSAMLQIQEVMPAWSPRTILDIGSGPGTGVIAADSVWPGVVSATCIDMNADLLLLGEKIVAETTISTEIQWKKEDITDGLKETEKYDLVILANVCNELGKAAGQKLIEEAYSVTNGVLLIIEPGTAFGHPLIQAISKDLSSLDGYLIAPFVQNSFVESKEYWIHFSQRFIRPEFQRHLRQQMRDSLHMASDWEEAKFCYTAICKVPPVVTSWGRCIGPVIKEKGFLTVPVLTKDTVMKVKVMKRNKPQYNFARDLKWGERIPKEEDVLVREKSLL